jgi:phospholipase/carboxylesterase
VPAARLPEGLAALARPAAGDPEGLLLLLHGRGADEHDLFPLVDFLDPDRRLLGITPRAPLSLPPGGAHWYAFREVGSPDPDTFRATFPRLAGWFDALVAQLGLPMERTAIGGFSQGAVMSYALALGPSRPRPAALLALSGFMPSVEGFELDLESLPGHVAIGHGVLDPIIGVEWGRRARASLERAGAKPLYREYPLGHSIDPSFLRELVPWLGGSLGFAAFARGTNAP